MRATFASVLCVALIGIGVASFPALAQQESTKDCKADWQANKAANQANGVTEKAYVAQCHGGTASSTTAAPTKKSAAASSNSSGQQETVKACESDWQANKAANQANGVTEKAYVAQCRGGAAATAKTAPVANKPAATAAASSSTGQQETVKQCTADWQANKAANQVNGITEKAYVAQCHGGTPSTTATATPAAPNPPPASAAAPTSNPSAAPAAATSAPYSAKPAPTVAATPKGANQYATEGQAKASCPSDTVVWANLNSKIFHFSGYKDYGNTKSGAYMCEGDATAQGFRASETEKPPT
jgi:hypothetical protein